MCFLRTRLVLQLSFVLMAQYLLHLCLWLTAASIRGQLRYLYILLNEDIFVPIRGVTFLLSKDEILLLAILLMTLLEMHIRILISVNIFI